MRSGVSHRLLLLGRRGKLRWTALPKPYTPPPLATWKRHVVGRDPLGSTGTMRTHCKMSAKGRSQENMGTVMNVQRLSN